MNIIDNINTNHKFGIKNITLVTTLKDGTPDLLSKADSLRSLFFACQANQVNYEIRVDNKLHGKIYIAIEDGKPKQGKITSMGFPTALTPSYPNT